MCESSAYLLENGKEVLIFQNVDFLETDKDQVKMVNLFGEKKIIKARVKAFSLLDHKILLEPF